MKKERTHEIGDIFRDKIFNDEIVIVGKNTYFENRYVQFVIKVCLPDGFDYYGVDEDYIKKLKYIEHTKLK